MAPSDGQKTLEKIAEVLKADANKQPPMATVERSRDVHKIIVPQELTLDEAVVWLQRQKEYEEKTVRINFTFDAFPWDGAIAMMEVFKRRYGHVQGVDKVGWFGIKTIPVLIEVETNFGEHQRVPWGTFQIPGVDGEFETGSHTGNDGMLRFRISGAVKRKHELEVQSIADEIRAYLDRNSIYRGKAVFVKTDGSGNLSMEEPLRFLDLRSVTENGLILNDDTENSLRGVLFNLVEHSARAKQFQIPLKRGILLEGHYGTGKTLTGLVVAKKAIENGWTFVYLQDAVGLPSVFKFAQMYSPAVIFAEDIDRVVGMERTEEANAVLNAIDGIDAKGVDIVVVLTTNHVESIHRAMLRPGRLDAVVSYRSPVAKTVERLFRLYGRTLIPANEDISRASSILEGQMPAVIRETVERAKLFALGENGNTIVLTGEVLANAANHVKTQIDLLTSLDQPAPESAEHRLGKALGEVIGIDSISSVKEDTSKILDIIDN